MVPTADIIYHLFDQFLAYRKGIEAKKEQEAAGKAGMMAAERTV
jgi:translation initiation factor IF-2